MPVIVASPAYPRPPLDGDKVRWSALLPELARLEPLHGVFGIMPSLGERRDRDFDRHFSSIEVVLTSRFEVTARAALLEIRRQASAFGRRATPGWTRYVASIAARHAESPILLLGTSGGFVPALPSPTHLDLIDVRSRVRTITGNRMVSPGVLRAEVQLATRHRLILTSESDRQWLTGRGVPEGRVEILPNGVDSRLLDLTPAPSSATVLFVGSLHYQPNLDAIRWFISTCWPGVRERHPGAILRIVGYGAHRVSASPGLEIFSDVPDISPHYQAAAVSIAPLLQARGVQNKVLEAMASGLPVVGTTPVAAGLFGDHPMLTADQPAALIDACLRLLNDAGERRRLGMAGRAYVRRHHDWAKTAFRLRQLLFA